MKFYDIAYVLMEGFHICTTEIYFKKKIKALIFVMNIGRTSQRK